MYLCLQINPVKPASSRVTCLVRTPGSHPRNRYLTNALLFKPALLVVASATTAVKKRKVRHDSVCNAFSTSNSPTFSAPLQEGRSLRHIPLVAMAETAKQLPVKSHLSWLFI